MVALYLALTACGAVIATASAASLLWTALCLVPVVNVIAIPSLIGSLLLLAHALPFAAYLLLAQTDAPKHSGSIFLPLSPARHLGLLVAVVNYVWFVATTGPRFVVASVQTAIELWRSSSKTYPPAAILENIRLNIPYHHKPRCKLDVFLAHSRPAPSPQPQTSPPISRVSSVTTLPDVDVGSQVDGEFPPGTWGDLAPGSPISEDPNLNPVVMLIYDVGTMGPIKPQKWMFWLLGNKLAQQGYVCVIPDITMYPHGTAEDMVSDVRHALAWTRKEIAKYGGDPANIHLMGHGLGAHLALYTISQAAVVHSRDRLEILNAASQWSHFASQHREIPNGLKSLRVYAPEADLPPIRGVIMLSPIADIIKQVRHESKCWVEHVSPLRRALGSSQTRCMKHSLGHILFAARHIVEADCLPEKALIIHGVNDTIVPVWQGIWLADLLNGLDMAVTIKQYKLAHFDVVTSMMTGFRGRSTDWLMHDTRTFIDGHGGYTGTK